MFLSNNTTSAQVPAATATAFMPDTPAPITTTRAGNDAGHAADQYASPTLGSHECLRADERREPARDLTHREEQRQRPSGAARSRTRSELVPASSNAPVHLSPAARWR